MMAIPEHLKQLRAKIGNDLIVLPAVTARILDNEGRLLLARHDYDEWGLPGGGVAPDEVPAEAVERQVREEVGLEVSADGVLGVYGGPHCRSLYPNGDQVSYVITVYSCRVRGGEVRPDFDEVSAIDFFTFEEASALKLMSWLRPALEEVFSAGV